MRKREYGIKFIVILLTICVLADALMGKPVVEAAEGRYGIWCPICGKWQDHFNGIVDGENLTVTEYTDGSMTCGYGKISVECIDCGKKLIYIKQISDYTVYNADTDDEYSIYWEDYEICRYEASVEFPALEAHADEDTSLSEGNAYRILSDNNVFASSSYWATEEEYEEVCDVVTGLFISLANCLTKTEKSVSTSNIVSRYVVTGKEFTWADWYDSVTRIDASGNKSSMLIWYLNQFGLTALRQNSYSITFYANGGVGSMEKVSTAGSYTLPTNTFSRDGYSFSGWAEEPDGTAVYTDNGTVLVSKDMVLYAVWQKEKEPPKLEVSGDVQVKLYRDGKLIDGVVQAGDKVELILAGKPGREYASAAVSTNPSDLAWNSATGVLSFTMPDADTSVQIYYRELQSLEVSLNALFYQTYQKAPYWNGESFDLDCGEPITVQTDMLDVKAVFYHTGTGQTEKRTVTDFTFTGSNQLQNLGENVISIEADVLGDGYVLSGQCVLTADSASLRELMEETDSQTYTELKEFVEGLTEELAACEAMIEELSSKLTISEEERRKCEEMLAKAVEESERLSKELEGSQGKLAEMTQELEKMTEKLSLMQELMQEMTGSEEIDASTVEALKEKFQEIEAEKNSLSDKMVQLEQEKAELLDRVAQLESEKAGLTDKVSGLESEKADLTDKVSGLESEKADLTDKVSGLESEKADLTGKVSGLESEKADLTDKLSGLESEKNGLNDKVSGLESASGSMAEKYAALLQENELLSLEKERLKRTNEELSDQLEHNLQEQSLLLKDYELLQENYTVLLEVHQQLEQEYQAKLSEKEQSLVQVKQEKEQLAGQVTALEKEKQELQAEKVTWQEEKQQLSSTVQILRAENKEWREQIQQLTEQKNAGIKSEEGAGKQNNAALQESETQNNIDNIGQTIPLDNSPQSDKLMEQESESVPTDKMTENQTETEGSESESAESGSLESESAESGSLEESETGEMDSEGWGLEESEAALQEQGFSMAVKSRRILPGIAVVIVAMLLGGAVLYLALEQKEKNANYTCD